MHLGAFAFWGWVMVGGKGVRQKLIIVAMFAVCLCVCAVGALRVLDGQPRVWHVLMFVLGL